MRFASAFALLLLASLTACGTNSSSSTTSGPNPVQSTARLVQTDQLSKQEYFLKADLDFSDAEKKESVLFPGKPYASKVVVAALHFVKQKRVSAAEALQASASCSLIVRASVESASEPILFKRTEALKIADLGVMTTKDSSTFELQLNQGFLRAFSARCRNVVDAAEFDEHLGHLIQARKRN